MIETPDPQTNRLATEGYARRLKRHASELVRLAAPIVASRSGFLMLIMADTIMTGHFSSTELAYLSIGLGIFMPLMIVSLGMIMGTLVLTANAHGAGKLADCGPIWRRSLQYALVLGIVGFAIGANGETLLLWTGQTPEIAAGGGRVVTLVSLGLPAHLMFLASAFFLEGLGRPTPAMLVMIVANVINVALNALMVFGGLGWMEPMGASGAVLATTATRWFMALAMMAIVWNLRDRDILAIRAPLTGGFGSWRKLRRIGYAVGISVGVESLAFSALNAFAGWLGEIPLAAYGMTFNLMALIFMLAIGIGSATAVRVGMAYGRGDIPDAALAGWTGLAATVLAMIVAGVACAIWSEDLAAIYTEDPALLALAAVTIAFMRWTSVPDGGQATMANALRGRGDVWWPCIIQTASFFAVMLPIAYVSAFTFDNGILGLLHGMVVGCVVSLLWQALRFHMLAARDAHR